MVTCEALFLTLLLAIPGETALLQFTAGWCGPCRTMAPIVQRLQTEGYPVQQIDIDQQRDLATRMKVTGIPCFVLLRDGVEIDRVVGVTTHARLLQMFDKSRNSSSGLGPGAGSLSGSAKAAGVHAAGESAASFPAAGGLQTAANGASGVLAGVPGRFAQPPSSQSTFAGVPASVDATRNLSSGRTEPVTARVGGVGLVAEASRNSHPEPEDWKSVASASTSRSAVGANGSSARQDAPTVVGREATDPQAMLEQALRATVRLRVADQTGHGCGTGTIIDTHGEEALVVTCGHIFRDSQGKGQIEVDLFVGGQARTLPGTLLSYNLERDIGLVSFSPGTGVTVARVAPGGYLLRKGSPVFSIGCDRGANPSIRTSQITGVDKYLGPPNLVTSGQPVQGRSGGGLFSQDGLLIGICNAADPADDEGIYASLPTIHWELDRVGQRRIYDRRTENALAGLAGPAAMAAGANRGLNGGAASAPLMPRTMPAANSLAGPQGPEGQLGFDRSSMGAQGQPVPGAGRASTGTGSNLAAAAPLAPTAGPSQLGLASARSLAATPGPAGLSPPLAPETTSQPGTRLADSRANAFPKTEVICIIRSPSDPRGGERVMVLDNPSVELISQLERASRGAAAAAEIASRVQREGMVPVPTLRGPVVRAQSSDR